MVVVVKISSNHIEDDIIWVHFTVFNWLEVVFGKTFAELHGVPLYKRKFHMKKSKAMKTVTQASAINEIIAAQHLEDSRILRRDGVASTSSLVNWS